jgi:hypothetical protein
MKIRKNNICFYLSFVVLFAFGVIALLCGSPVLTFIGTVLKAIPIIVLIYYINSDKNGLKAIVVAAAYVVSFVISFLEYYLDAGFPFSASPAAAIASTLYLLPLIILTADDGKKKWIAAAVTIITALITYFTGKVTIERNMYLYATVENFSSYIFYSKLALILTVLVPVSELVFRTKKNYLSDALIVSATVMMLFAENAAESTNILISPSLYLGILTLLIYIARTGEEFEAGERRKIVFSTLHVQEIAPLRKKRRPRVYEIPPNVPARDPEDLKK